jgi:hypothetical protein
MCHAPAVGWLNEPDSQRSSASPSHRQNTSAANRMTELFRRRWQRPCPGHLVEIDQADQGRVWVSSIHGPSWAPARSGRLLASPEQRAAGMIGLVTLRCGSAGRRRDAAGSNLLQLPEGTHEARAEAEDDKQQQEGLIDGWDLYHGVDKATPMPLVPATVCAGCSRAFPMTQLAKAPNHARLHDACGGFSASKAPGRKCLADSGSACRGGALGLRFGR